ncbi:hypothetical protein [Mucilaginibacter myungsuensis]|uniref:Uncharacterized protein n=1 Tax=Mucilaginibacter myungsuensis TaxID=649104 RepID=A0A929KT10_9SPHI|nr:hypothetical protein [Mucilaginibacter myungsuensis]MBE9660272.1 hypothetical protein [Mucilaginibacter myungsuensis]MDN3600314.1 hypothetical protein [Mucilaginibacter myungsuensis]
MKRIGFILSFLLLSSVGYAQKQLISYEDLKYLIENNLGKADTFFVSKGYTITKQDLKKKTRVYTAKFPGGTKSDINMRADGRKMFVEIETDEIAQYNMIHNSIAAFLIKNGELADVETYKIKELGNIYIMVKDKFPYSPIRKDYDIHLVADKNIMSYN